MVDTAQRERIEEAIERDLGFQWTEQMRHGYKALKLWNALVAATAENARLQAIVGAYENLVSWYEDECERSEQIVEHLPETLREREQALAAAKAAGGE